MADQTITNATVEAVAAIAASPPPPTSDAILAAAGAATAGAMTVNIYGYSVNLIAVMIMVIIVGILYIFWKIQRSKRLDFADMITKDGERVSMTKVLQLVGGLTATWIMIKLTLTGGLTEALFGLYLTYVGAIEGYSKFITAKYGYAEKSIKEATTAEEEVVEAPHIK